MVLVLALVLLVLVLVLVLVLLLVVLVSKVRQHHGGLVVGGQPLVNDGDMKNESPASGRISMSSAALTQTTRASELTLICGEHRS